MNTMTIIPTKRFRLSCLACYVIGVVTPFVAIWGWFAIEVAWGNLTR